MIRGALASRYGISPLGRGVIRPASGGWWLSGGIAAANCIAAYQPKGAADYATSKVNLANPGTYNAADGAAYPTWDDTNGWKFDGVASQYLSTGVIPTVGHTWSAVIRFTNNSKNYGRILGTGTQTLGEFSIIPSSSGTRRYWSGGMLSITGALTAGIMGFAGSKAFKNGTAETGSIATGADTGTWLPILMGALNWATGATGFATVYIQAAAFFNSVITDDQMIAVQTAMAAL